MIALAANKDFDFASMDIMTAFLQAKALDRDVFMKLQHDQGIEGYLWKLKKPMHGLDDTSRKLRLKLNETLIALGLKHFIICMNMDICKGQF